MDKYRSNLYFTKTEIHDNIHVLEYKLNILKYVRGEDQNEKN